eukprot:9267803-Lingulodinium_polyedra.AAC.1
MDLEFVVELTLSWGATFVVAANPDLLLLDPEWAGARATCVAAGGDGYAYVSPALLDEGRMEEPTV